RAARGAHHRFWIATRRLARLVERFQHRQQFAGVLVPIAIPDIGVAGRQTHHARAFGPNQDRYTAVLGARAARDVARLIRLIILALEVCLALANERRNDLQPLFETADAFVER